MASATGSSVVTSIEAEVVPWATGTAAPGVMERQRTGFGIGMRPVLGQSPHEVGQVFGSAGLEPNTSAQGWADMRGDLVEVVPAGVRLPKPSLNGERASSVSLTTRKPGPGGRLATAMRSCCLSKSA